LNTLKYDNQCYFYFTYDYQLFLLLLFLIYRFCDSSTRE